MLGLYILLSSLLISAAFCSIDQPMLPGNGDVTDAQEGFPGHVALRPDYTFWNVMRMLRRIFDSNLERRKGEQVPFPIRDLRARRMLLNFSNSY
ncbi:unnamed protein product [Cylicocyclus nassatus]|uniref:Uncharacterized protein n=1 Tax=Cylicocyclus nassatus TaxID=53992 RepID=A0AA36MD53_CYLNA|nr:unnamed protein product [Cylicocyclus nassatus]